MSRYLVLIILNLFIIHVSHCYLSWVPASIQLPSPIVLPAYSTINERILYLFGGYIENDNIPSNKIYKLDIHTGQWTVLPITIPNEVPIYCYQCAIINSTLIYIVTQHTNTILIFDTTTDTFILDKIFQIQYIL